MAAEGRNFPLPGGGQHQYQLLDVEDLCRAIESALVTPRERINHVFNIGTSDFDTMGADFQAVLDYAGYGKRIVSLPQKPFTRALEIAHKLGISPVYPWITRNLLVSSAVDISRAQNFLGFKPNFSNRDALIRNFEWYLKHSETSIASAGVTHTLPWKQGALRLAKTMF